MASTLRSKTINHLLGSEKSKESRKEEGEYKKEKKKLPCGNLILRCNEVEILHDGSLSFVEIKKATRGNKISQKLEREEVGEGASTITTTGKPTDGYYDGRMALNSNLQRERERERGDNLKLMEK